MARRSPRQRSLWGGFEPEPRDPRGRKAVQWDRQAAEIVAVLAADGATQEAIAAEVGLSVKTLVKIYSDELKAGAALIRRAVLQAQVSKALKGDTAAARFVAQALEATEAAEVAYRAPTAPTAPRLGKKEQRQADAEQVGLAGIYAPRPPPASVTSH